MSRVLDVLGTPDWGSIHPNGVVSPASGTWTLDWWAATPDGWHRASAPGGTRQHATAAGAVVQTHMKLPTGDLTQRVWAVPSGGATVAVVELRNDTPEPLAVALAVTAAGAALALTADGLTADGMPLLGWDRPPAHAALGPEALHADTPDPATPNASARPGSDRLDTAGRDAALLIWPLPHTAVLRTSTLLNARTPAPAVLPPPSRLPGAEDVIRGWQAHLDRGARIELPDETANARILQQRREWLGRTGRVDSLEVAELCQLAIDLHEHGHPDDAATVVAELLARHTTAAPMQRLQAFGTHHDLTGDADAARACVQAVAEAVEAAARHAKHITPDQTTETTPDDGFLTESIARLLRAAGETRAADDLHRLTLPPSPATPRLRTALVDDRADGSLNLLDGFQTSWLGRPLAVYDLPTRFGPISYAVRWHGTRPALLWELTLRPRCPQPTWRAPALDPAWSTSQPTGETLLAAPADN